MTMSMMIRVPGVCTVDGDGAGPGDGEMTMMTDVDADDDVMMMMGGECDGCGRRMAGDG